MAGQIPGEIPKIPENTGAEYGADAAVQKSRANATKEHSGQSTYEQSAAHLKISTGQEVLTHVKTKLNTLQGDERLPELPQKDLDRHIGSQVKGLHKLRDHVAQKLPDRAREQNHNHLEQIKEKLDTLDQQLGAKSSKVDPKQVETLSTTLNELQSYAKQLNPSEQSHFYEAQAKMFQELSEQVNAQLGSLREAYNNNMIKVNIQNNLKDLNNFFKGSPPLQMSPKNAEQIFEKLQDLFVNRPDMRLTQQKQFDSFIDQISQLTFTKYNGQQVNMGNQLAMAMFYFSIEKFLKGAPGASKAEIIQHLQEMIKQFPAGAIKSKMELILKNIDTFLPRFTSKPDLEYQAVSSTKFFSEFQGQIEELPEPPPSIAPFYSDEEVEDFQAQNRVVGKHIELVANTRDALKQGVAASRIASQQAVGQSPRLTAAALTDPSRSALDNIFGRLSTDPNEPTQERMIRQMTTHMAWDHQGVMLYQMLLGKLSGMEAPSKIDPNLASRFMDKADGVREALRTTLGRLGYTDGEYNPQLSQKDLQDNLGKVGYSKAWEDSLLNRHSLTHSATQKMGAQLAQHDSDVQSVMHNIGAYLEGPSEALAMEMNSSMQSLFQGFTNQLHRASHRTQTGKTAIQMTINESPQEWSVAARAMNALGKMNTQLQS